MSDISIYDESDDDGTLINAHVHISFHGNDVDFNGYGETEEIAKEKLILEIRHARTALSDWLDANTSKGI